LGVPPRRVSFSGISPCLGRARLPPAARVEDRAQVHGLRTFRSTRVVVAIVVVDAVREAAIPRRHRRLVLLVVLVTLAVLFVLATARLFVWPARGAPAHADAVVMFNGYGDRWGRALALGAAHVAPNLVLSVGPDYRSRYDPCAKPIPDVRMTCFVPSPSTTQGEAEFVGRLAAANHWRSIILVTTRPQATRARLRMERCFNGRVYVATVGIRARDWPYTLAYEWGAMLKAEVLQRGC
jgi:hypothetical protein